MNDTTTYKPTTPAAVRSILENARETGTRLLIRYGHTEPIEGDPNAIGRDWLQESDVTGRIGRSMGQIKVPLLIANSRAHGGGAILDHCIVKIATARGKHTLYQHPAYHQPTLTFGDVQNEGYAEAIYADGRLHAQFKNKGQARRWAKRLGLVITLQEAH